MVHTSTINCLCDFIMTFLANSHFILQISHAKTFEGKIIYKAIEVSCLINLHFPSNLNFSFRGMLLNAECSASLFNQVALQISRYFFLTRVKPYLVFLLSWISSITTFLSLSLHSEIAGRFRAHDLNFWLISSKRPSLLALLQLEQFFLSIFTTMLAIYSVSIRKFLFGKKNTNKKRHFRTLLLPYKQCVT